MRVKKNIPPGRKTGPVPANAPQYSHNLQRLRLARGESLSAVGRAVGCGARTICRFERGIRTPNADMIIRLARFFDCTTDQILV